MNLSVIVPVYNCVGCLPALANTIKALQGEDLEVILVDDGSTDGSGEGCDRIAEADSRVRVLHKPNGGVSTARNMGLDAAAGEYIGFLDADDGTRPDMYQRLLASARTHDSDMVMGGYEKVDNAGRTNVAIPLDPVLDTVPDIRKVAMSMAFWNAWMEGGYLPSLYGSVWPNLYRSALIRRHGIRFPEGIAIGEDLLFNLEYLSHVQRLSVVNEPLYAYNTANPSATRKQNQMLWQRYSALLERETLLMRQRYGGGDLLEYNLHRQRINYAINVGEEQLCVFLDRRAAVSALRGLCRDPRLQESAAYVMKHGRSLKERAQAALIRGKCAGLMRLWLK